MMRNLALLSAFFAALAAPRLGAACSLVAPFLEHTIDPTLEDDIAPGPVTVTESFVSRLEPSSGCGASPSCGSSAVFITPEPAADSATPATEMGYKVTLVQGTLPHGMTLPDEAVRTNSGGNLLLYFSDTSTVSFVISIAAVDLAGNVGPATLVSVYDPGTGAGCQTSSADSFPTTTAILWLAILAIVRRRQPRKSQ